MVPFLNGKAADPATRFTFAQTWRRDDTGCRDDRPQLGSSRRVPAPVNLVVPARDPVPRPPGERPPDEVTRRKPAPIGRPGNLEPTRFGRRCRSSGRIMVR